MPGRFAADDERSQNDSDSGLVSDSWDGADPLFDLERETWETNQETGYAVDENDPVQQSEHVIHVFA